MNHRRRAGRLVFGEVMHRRLFPVRYRFSYRICSVLLDVDKVDEAIATCRLFSHNRFNLFSFYERDHGPRDGSDLRAWLDAELRRIGAGLSVARVELLCFPRFLGYVFNPLSIWYCYSAAEELIAILCEVRNTFGEKHAYLLHDDNRPMAWPVRACRRKGFHVSPFIDMNAVYRFRFARRRDGLSIAIREYQSERLLLVAVQNGTMRALTDRALVAAAVAVPLPSMKVIFMIHWQALRIWLRGAPLFRKPPPPKQQIS